MPLFPLFTLLNSTILYESESESESETSTITPQFNQLASSVFSISVKTQPNQHNSTESPQKMGIRKSNKLPAQAASLKQILKRYSSLGKKTTDVPKGHFAVYVGDNRARYIVPISFLSRPEFQTLLQQAEEEYGFNHHHGLTIPCDENDFQALTNSLLR